MSYLTDEQTANEALAWWERYPDSIEALVSILDDTASDEHGNVVGHVEWQHHPTLKIMLAGTNGLVYSARHAKQDSGWHKFYVTDEEKETQRIFKRRLQASNKATKMNTSAEGKAQSANQNTKGITTMAIIETVSSAHTFRNAFVNMGRKDQFSRDALEALFEYYEQLSEDTGEHIELDVIAICCEWCEYGEDELFNDYGTAEGLAECDSDMEEYIECIVEELENATQVIKLDGSYLVMAH